MRHHAETSSASLSRRKRIAFRVIMLVLVYGGIELIAWQMDRMAPLPPRQAWALERVRAGGCPFRFVPHPYALYMPRPGHVGFAEVREHNRLGFRSEEIAQEKPSGRFRIVCLGGSTTYSITADRPERTFPGRLQEYLRTRTGNDRHEVVNAGCPGATSAEVLQTFAFRILPLEPAIIVVHTGINDAGELEMAGHRLDYAHGRRPFVLPRYSGPSRALLASPTYRLVFARTRLPYWLTEGISTTGTATSDDLAEPAAYQANTASLILLARERGIRVLFVPETLWPGDLSYERAFDEAFPLTCQAGIEVAREHDVPICRFDRFPSTTDDWADPAHLKPEAITRKAAFIGRAVIEKGLLDQAIGKHDR